MLESISTFLFKGACSGYQPTAAPNNAEFSRVAASEK